MKWFVFLLGFVGFALCHAQVAEEEKKPRLQVKLLAVIVPENLGQVYLQSGETKTAAFDLSANNVSDSQAVDQRNMTLHTVNKDLPLCSIALPEGGNEFIIVLSPAKPSGYRSVAVRTDDPAFRRGDVFFLNLTTKTVLGKLGTRPLTLEPGKSALNRADGPKEKGYYDIAFATRQENEDRLFSSSRWPIDDQIRSYLFFLEDATGRVTYRAVDEFIPPEKKK
ncbi:MAG: hypothetical protein RLZZ553_1074 [Verrucomicrobiota bacterium]|jgi:hypothetical protein